MALIHIDRVNKYFGDFHALKDISLEIEEGEFVALLGPSGCGKTTLLRAIAGFVETDSGEIRIDGQPLQGVDPNRRPVNMVFQDYALFPHLTVWENVAFGPRRARWRRSKISESVDEALGTVGMTDFGRRYPRNLSGGQQQRIALARAIVNRPKVLLLDEPLAALDLKLRKRMQMELKHLQQQLGITFLFVTHDQEEALVMADRIVVMEGGRVEQVGSGRDIYTRPSSRYVADFIGDANILPCAIGEDNALHIQGDSAHLPYDAPSGDPNPFLMIRPEDMIIEPKGPEDVRLPGEITDRVFVGNATRIHVRLDSGQEVMIQLPGLVESEACRVGSRTDVGWSPGSATLLSA